MEFTNQFFVINLYNKIKGKNGSINIITIESKNMARAGPLFEISEF
jgi:hypothetical protein